MANLMHKLFKNKSTQRLIVSLKSQQLPTVSPSLIPHHVSLTKPDSFNDPSFFLNPKPIKDGIFTQPLKFYPNFPFGYLLNPIGSIGFDPFMAMEIEEGTMETEDDAGKLWADSVKKKRKKKMNKHKYKKLRKRLRRKT
ncbi:uncharacterized protein LOC120208015 [Hibiscus syriacus]|uniref:uncharacterized protein LOC120208015 n=1 Tax=Hibiscus syriacus TaxID=106335 RepID=UPI001922D980|nr:uncharacterized protein LOC120208015 [Hibiscus syriacus]